MIKEAEVVLDGVVLKKIWSDSLVKIQCNEDMNIYQVVYTTLSSTSTFSETNIPVEEYKIPASEIIGLSAEVLKIIDRIDGSEDQTITVDPGGAE